jgi:hypothetical protein
VVECCLQIAAECSHWRAQFVRNINDQFATRLEESGNNITFFLELVHRPFKVGSHRIQGISDEFIPAIVRLDELGEIISVSDGDSILMAQKLAAELGLGVGISSGANFLGAIEVQERLGPDAVVVTIFADDNKKYLSTDLLQAEPVREHYLSPEVELMSFDVFKRVCNTCCEFPEEQAVW